MHLIHFYGVLAPNAKLRKFVVPEAPDDEDSGCGHSVAYENEARSGRATKSAGNRMSQAAERRGNAERQDHPPALDSMGDTFA